MHTAARRQNDRSIATRGMAGQARARPLWGGHLCLQQNQEPVGTDVVRLVPNLRRPAVGSLSYTVTVF